MNKGLPDRGTAMPIDELLDHDEVDWQRVRHTRYAIHQHLIYEYPGPIYDLNQRLMILPPHQHGDQRLLDYRLGVSASHYEMICQDDSFGNREIRLAVPHVERVIDFEAWILVERSTEAGAHYTSADWLTDARLLEPSTLTRPDDALRQAAQKLSARCPQGLPLAELINDWTYHALKYRHEVTDIHTTAAEALALGEGVCQDFAHIMLALCRLCGLPARYASGHMLGEGGTHAWVEVLVPVEENPEVALVVPFDPTHGRRATLSYLTIAVGSDYYNVAPTSGTFRAEHRGQLTAHKRVGLTAVEYS